MTILENERVYSLDFLRGMAAFAVAIPHFLSIEYSQTIELEIISILSVEIFFALSGFVLAPQIIYCLTEPNMINLRIFLVRRWIRTVPLFLLALLAMTFLTRQNFGGDFIRYGIYSSNLWAQLNTVDYFQTAWSLSIEEWFYIVFPILGMIARYKSRMEQTRFLFNFSILFILLIFLIRSVFGDFDNWGDSVRRITIFRLDAIAFGFLIFLLLYKVQRCVEIYKLVSLTFLTVMITGFISYETARLIASTGTNWAKNLFPFISAILGCSLVLLFYQLDPIFRKNKIMKMMAIYLGKMSYSIYLLQIVVATLIHHFFKIESVVANLFVYIFSLLLVSMAIYNWFEKPLLKARPKWPHLDNRLLEPKTLRSIW